MSDTDVKTQVLQPINDTNPVDARVLVPVKPPDAGNYVQAFDPKTDVASVTPTGNANVKIMSESAQSVSALSVPGGFPSDVLILVLLAGSIFILTRGKK